MLKSFLKAALVKKAVDFAVKEFGQYKKFKDQQKRNQR